MRTKMKGGRMNTDVPQTAEDLYPKNIKNNPALMTPYYENIDIPKKQTQSETQNNTLTEVNKPTPSSNINLFSTKIRQFNNYPEFKSNAGINQVIQLLGNINNIPLTKKKGF